LLAVLSRVNENWLTDCAQGRALLGLRLKVNRKRAIVIAISMGAALALGAWLLTIRFAGARSVSGTIETDEVRVASRYGGRVEKIHAQEGDWLRAGQIIVELDAAELRARRDYAAAQLDLALDEERRVLELFQQKVASEQERDNAVTRARLQRAQLAELEAQLREMQIIAPSDCVLEVLHVKVGDVLAPNREVATLLLPQHLWVRVYVPEAWLGHIQLGQQVKVRTDSFGKKEFTGVVEQINRAAEFTPRNVQTVADRIRQVYGVKVRLPNEEGLLRAGMSADVFFPDVPAPPK
jgi:HlyD family secretion protein